MDLLVVTTSGKADGHIVQDVLWRSAEAEGDDWLRFAAHVRNPGHVAYKRSVEDFFQCEVDRDRLVLGGSP